MKQILSLLFLFATIKVKAADTTLAITRFSPHPVQVAGLQAFSVDLNGSWFLTPPRHLILKNRQP
ncbi:hypothetical protein [Niabella hibiscisoli]|uniref:hypothetical protein n=1 Tax=Niabella hibiscisoli TaxID=1825928 RepID=UPI001F0FBA7F|nr:hypothetical protein [Niabella hibiscisoli]MCH5719244.1 hypothetical protein [Niabella hibiscisoli]